MDEVCRPDSAGEALLREAGERFGWSARAYYRVLKVARSIADLAGSAMPSAAQIGKRSNIAGLLARYEEKNHAVKT